MHKSEESEPKSSSLPLLLCIAIILPLLLLMSPLMIGQDMASAFKPTPPHSSTTNQPFKSTTAASQPISNMTAGNMTAGNMTASELGQAISKGLKGLFGNVQAQAISNMTTLNLISGANNVTNSSIPRVT